MTGQDYEYAAARYLRRHGYHGVRVTRASGDYGVDIVCRRGGHRYAVQCKYYTHPVGIAAVQQAVAGKARYDCDSAMVITNSTLTRAALELAESNGVTVLQEVAPGVLTDRLRSIIGAAGGLGWVAVLILSMLRAWQQTGELPLGQPVDKAWSVPLGVTVLPGILWLLSWPVRWVSTRIAQKSSIRHEAHLRQQEQQDELDLLACREAADRDRCPLPAEAFRPAGCGPDRLWVLSFFPDNSLMESVLEAMGDRAGFSMVQFTQDTMLSP